MNLTSERIKQLRKRKGLSQLDLAELVGVKRNTISTWERGTRKPDLSALSKLSRIFDVSYEYILGDIDEEVNQCILTDEIKDSINKYLKLNPKNQKLITEMINTAFEYDLKENK